MKYLLLLFVIILFSCSEAGLEERWEPKIAFEPPFPKSNYNLTRLFGSEFTLKNDGDTASFKVFFNKKTKLNVISELDGDTVFYGLAEKYKGDYYLSYQLPDSTYWIQILSVEDSLVKGFGTLWSQMYYTSDLFFNDNDSLQEREQFGKLIIEESDTSEFAILSTVNKKLLREMFLPILDKLKTDTLIQLIEHEHKEEPLFEENIINDDTTDSITDNTNLVRSFYPNPVVDILQIERNQAMKAKFRVSNLKGVLVHQGSLENEINLSELNAGGYIIKVIEDQTNKSQSFRIRKD